MPVAARCLAQSETAKLAEEVMAGLPKNVLAGLGIGVVIGGLTGYLLSDRERADGRDADDFADGYARGFSDGRRGESHAARIADDRKRSVAADRGASIE